ncbi:fasciclin domain-containing protein [Sphingomonas sp. PB4P5]|uniref:fasciclin domain-containing protein n=1 Tax=Parasphingomonas puruogangriensis TaxID=3096155 RepID=UPI002FCA1553
MTSITKLPLVALVAALSIGTVSAQTTTARTTAPTTAPTAAAPVAPTAKTAPAAPAAAVPNPDVGGVKMEATKTIVDNAAAAPNLTTLVKAVQAAGLAATLSGPGPFTVFAPTNDAFGRLAPGTVDTLLKPEAKPLLIKALTYHVVPGSISAEQLKAQITAGGGKATLTTVEGEPLVAEFANNALSLTDIHGNKSYVEVPDVRQSNGIVHVVNGVLLPKLD